VLLPVLLALPLGCRGTFDLDKYVTDGESGTMTSATSLDETATTVASETRADETSTDTDDTTDATATSDSTDTTDTTDTDSDCAPPLFEIGLACIGLRQSFQTGNSPTDMEVVDFSNDTVFLDLLLPGAPVSYFDGLPGGVFDDAIAVIGATGPRLASIDWDMDGLPDFVVISDGQFQFFTGEGNGNFNGGAIYVVGGHDAAFGDFDGDNDVDMVLSGPTLRGFERDGTGNLLLPSIVDIAASAQAIVAADLDGDEYTDLVLAMPSMGQIGVILVQGAWEFPNPIQTPLAEVADVAVANIDANAGLELLAVGSNGPAGVLFLGRVEAGAIMQSASYVVGGGPHALSVGDIDGDSVDDVAVANFTTQDVSVLLGEDGLLTNEFRLPGESIEDFPESIVVADLEGDGKAEIIVGMINSERVLVYGAVP
jgi:hypothetical protein